MPCELIATCKAHPPRPRVYFVKMDIKAAFDTIKQDKVLEVVAELLDKVKIWNRNCC